MNLIPKISIIIPFYNGEEFYGYLLNSLRKAILSYQERQLTFELIVIIDSMETGLNEMVYLTENYFRGMDNVDIIVRKNDKNLGVAGTRNRALDLCRGDYLHLIDQDDQVDELFYKEVLGLSDKYNFIVVNGKINYNTKRFNSHKCFYLTPELTVEGLLKNDFIRSPGQVVFSKELIQGFGFPEPKNYKGADDRFFWLRVFLANKEKLKPYYLDSPLYIAFIHDQNYSADQLNLRRSSLENWNILCAEVDISQYIKLVKADINSLKYSLGEKMDFENLISGGYHRLKYFLDPNKIIRFFFKRFKLFNKYSII